MAEHDQDGAPDSGGSDVTPGAGGGSTQGGGAGSGLGLSEESRARAQTEELSEGTGAAVASPRSAASGGAPTAAPPASRTVPASGDRGRGGGLGDAAGGARRGTAAAMTGSTAHVGDAAIELPAGGSATHGAAQGSGMSRGVADPHPLGSADPGAGTAMTGRAAPEAPNETGPEESGLGDTAGGGQLQDYDAAFKNRNEDGS